MANHVLQKFHAQNNLNVAAVPQLRLSMPKDVFNNMVYYACQPLDVEKLWRMEVFREDETDNIIEIWCGNVMMEYEVMKTLLSAAKENLQMWEMQYFRLVKNGDTIMAFRWDSKITVETLKMTAIKHFAIKSGVKLLHLGIELKKGLLTDYEIGPASILIVHEV
eukprot:12431446-Karenia_brevis.AAC.1